MAASNYRIRPLAAGDIEAALAIEQKIQTDPWSRESFLSELSYEPPRFFILGIHDSSGAERVAGLGGCRSVSGESYLLNLGVDPLCQRMGLGGALLSFLIQLALKQGSAAMHLDVRADNEAAIRFYKSFGFQETALRPKMYRDGSDGYAMTKIL